MTLFLHFQLSIKTTFKNLLAKPKNDVILPSLFLEVSFSLSFFLSLLWDDIWNFVYKFWLCIYKMSDKTTAPNKLEIKLPLTFHHFCTRESCGSWSPQALLVPGYLYLEFKKMKQCLTQCLSQCFTKNHTQLSFYRLNLH